ncbi:MAG: hypothetical protein WC554_18855 [Clostridia bacterium]
MSSGGVPVVNTPIDLDNQTVRQRNQPVFSHTGRLILFDDFTDGIDAWWRTNNQTVWSSELSYGKGYCCRMQSTAAVSTIIQHYFPGNLPFYCLTGALQIGIELTHNINNVDTHAAIWFNFDAAMYSDTTLQLMGTNNNVITLETPLNFSREVIHRVKLVADFSSKKYDKLYLDDSVYDLSQWNLYDIPGWGSNYNVLRAMVTNAPRLATGGYSYIPYIIITDTEP